MFIFALVLSKKIHDDFWVQTSTFVSIKNKECLIEDITLYMVNLSVEKIIDLLAGQNKVKYYTK